MRGDSGGQQLRSTRADTGVHSEHLATQHTSGKAGMPPNNSAPGNGARTIPSRVKRVFQRWDPAAPVNPDCLHAS